MKINGIELSAPKNEVVVIPRDGTDLVIYAQAVLSYEEFDALCPTPSVPEKILSTGEVIKEVTDAEYVAALDVWSDKRWQWMILKSLEVTEGLVWETVVLSDSDTWKNYKDDLTKVFRGSEIARIINLVYAACGLDQTKIDEATKSFLASQAAQLNKE